MSWIDIWPWAFFLLSIIGVLLNIQKKPSGFIFYTISNIGWVTVNIYKEVPAQAALFIIFTFLSIYGWISWKFEKPKKTTLKVKPSLLAINYIKENNLSKSEFDKLFDDTLKKLK